MYLIVASQPEALNRPQLNNENKFTNENELWRCLYSWLTKCPSQMLALMIDALEGAFKSIIIRASETGHYARNHSLSSISGLFISKITIFQKRLKENCLLMIRWLTMNEKTASFSFIIFFSCPLPWRKKEDKERK